MSSSLSLLAKAILCLDTNNLLPTSLADELRSLCPPEVVPEVVPEVAPEVVPSVVASPIKEKKVRKIAAATKAVAAAPAAPAAPATPAAPAAAAAPAAPAPSNTESVPVATTNWRDHPSRLKAADINNTLCLGRKLDLDNPLEGTKGKGGMIFPEKQCSKKPMPGSKLCAKCAEKDAESKANPKKNNAQWHGRLDEETLYPRAKIVGSALFHERYPNGIPCDSTTTTTAKNTTPATVAVDTAPVTAAWKSFMYEGRLHIRNLSSNKVYYADNTKDTPDANAVKEQYVGRWTDGQVELIGDSDDE